MTILQRFTLALLFSLAASFALSACDDDESINNGGDTAGDTTGDATTDTSTDTGGDTSGANSCQGKTLCTNEGARRCETGPERIVECREDADGCLVEQISTQCATAESCEDNNGSPVCVNPCADIAPEDACTIINAKQCNGDVLEACETNVDNCLVWNTQADCTTETGANSCGQVNNVTMCMFDICRDEAACTPGITCNGDTLTTCRTNATGCLEEVTFDCTTTTDSTCDAANSVCTTTGDPCEGVAAEDLCDTAGAMCNPANPNELWVCAPNAFGCLVAQATDCTALPGLPSGSTGFCDGSAANAAFCAIDPGDRCAGETLCADTDPLGSTCNPDGTQLVTCTHNAVGCFVQTTETCADTDPTFVCVVDDAADDACAPPPPACTDECTTGDTSCDAGFIMTCAADGDTDPCLEFVQGTDCIATNQACDASSGTALCVTANESCTSALLVAPPFSIAGSAAGVADDLTGTTDCAAFVGTDLVFSVNVSAGDVIHIREVGDQGVFSQHSFVQVQTTCGDSACEPILGLPNNERGILFTASADGMIFPSVELDAVATAYDVRINTVTATDIGSFAAGDAIPDQISTTPLTDGDSAFYTITFTEGVLLSGTATSLTGDIDLFVYDETGTLVTSFEVGGDESFTDYPLPAGTYMFWAYAYYASGDADSHALTLSTQGAVCGDTDVELSEACDDGNTDGGDGCAADCLSIDAGDTCGTAIDLDVLLGGAPSGTFGPFDTTGFAADFGPYTDTLCAAGDFFGPDDGLGADTLFSVTVADGETLTVTMNAFFDEFLGILTSCGPVDATNCAFGSDSGAATYTNTTGADQVVFIVADGWSATSDGSYTLDVSLDTFTPENCTDTIDNDGDTFIDCFDTLDCSADPSCAGVCLVPGVRTGDLGTATGNSVASGTASGTSSYTSSGCGGNGPEAAYDWTAPSTGCFRLDTIGSSHDTVLHVRGCDDGAQVDCNDEGPTGVSPRSQLDINVTAGEELVIVVDSYFSGGGDYVLSINPCP